MIRRSDCYIRSIILSLLILSGLAVSLYSQDKQISGVINVYRRVVAFGPGLDNVTLNRVDSIASGDTVLLIQMKGAIIYEVETSFYGSYRESQGLPGSYEFMIVLSVNTGTKRVIFSKNISKSYNVAGIVQLVKVPSYNSVTVRNVLTCQPWDSTNKTGGVLAMIVERNLTLNANIDVTGKGFIGGAAFQGQGICLETNTALYDKFSYPASFTNSGFKGESQASRVFISGSNIPSNFPAYAKGKGNNFTGGGGGNGRFSGGGGGSNYGVGGNGGMEIGTCSPSPGNGAIGGRQVKFTDLDGGVFLGGGGGSSTNEAGSSASPGSRGGGIIIILCDTLIGNGKSIKADGATPQFYAGSNAGAGGGGGGGSITLYQQSYSTIPAFSALTISANGGKGGNNSGNFGEGGGGGGGLILTNNIPVPANVIKTVSGGPGGTRSGGSTVGTAGSAGESLTTFRPILTGFLFNSVRSSVTNDQVDSICFNMVPPMIRGTKPVAGSTPYTYLWEKSYDQNIWIPLVNDSDPTNYTPRVKETSTVYFRRTVTDPSVPPPLIDVSKPVMIIVQPSIKNNIVGSSDTICFNGDPPLLQQLLPDLLVPSTKHLFFNWQDSSATSSWGSTKATSKNYDPPAGLKKTSWYRRTVTSGRCVDSTAKAKITVIDTIRNNTILNSPPDICFGMTFTNLTASDAPFLAGGDNTYKFRWESNINDAGWGAAPGINNRSGYDPVELPQRIPSNIYYFRRVVYSGNHNVCENTSSSVILRDFPVISNNVISSNQVICSGANPVKLTGSNPVYGNGTYAYSWQDSSKFHSWTNISGSTAIDYQPPSLADTTRYRRIVFSSACSHISKSIKINVHKPITNNNISLIAGGLSDTTICSGTLPHLLKGTVAQGGSGIQGDYAYQWLFSTDNASWNPVLGAGTGVSYQPPALNATIYFKRRVISGACDLTSSSSIKITVLPVITNNTISATQPAICYNSAPESFTGATLSGGAGTYSFFWEQSSNGGTIWSPAAGTNNSASGSYQAPVLTVPMKYRRTVKSGANDCCINISNILDIGINSLPKSKINAGHDTQIYSIEKTYRMTADPPLPGETGFWTVIGNGSSSIKEISNNLAEVRNLAVGNNSFLWTITNGPCKLEATVNIYLLKDFIPRGFSPNNDNLNDKLIIEGLDLANQIAELRIVNGAGTEVFSTTNKENREWTPWDGKNSKGIDLPEGTYYYLLKITSKVTGQVFRKSGFIVLKRYK